MPNPSKPPSPPKGPKYTDKNLYAPGGPASFDIKQDSFGDCYFVATLAAVAKQNPKIIREAIVYRANTQTFRVRLYSLDGKTRYITVTQAEIEDNVKRHGGSYMDNTGNSDRAWPAVMETAYAKMFDSNAKNGLGEGYKKIANGGWPADAMMAVTGSAGKEVKFVYEELLAKQGSVTLLGARIAVYLIQKKSITLWSVPEVDNRNWLQKLGGQPIAQDGLVDNHVYTVESMTLRQGDWLLLLRNPWGTNLNVGEGRDNKSAYITVSLRVLVETGGLQSFRVSL